jgi:hypothetical protein
MKKNLHFKLMIALLVISGWGFAQKTIDYETVGNTWGWNTFEVSPVWSIVANPDASGINTSATVGKLVVNTSDQPWAGVQCALGDFGPFTVTAANHIVKVMVYKPVISDVGLKFATASGWAKPEVKVPNTKINQWEELTFDLTSILNDPPPGGEALVQIIIFPDYVARTTANTCFIDNISFPGYVPPTVDVSTHALTIAAPAGSTKTFDITTSIGWTVASNQTWLTPSPASGTGNATITLTATANTAATDRTANVTVTGSDATTQIVTVAQAGVPVVIPAAPTPPVRDAANVISFFSDAYTNVTGTNFAPGWGQATAISDVTLDGNAAKKYTNFNYIGIDFAGNHQNASAMTTLHVDIFPTDETSVRITPISPGPKEAAFALTPLTPNTWNSFDIALTSFTGVVMSDIFQFKFDGGTFKTFYMDNLYLYNGTVSISKLDKSGISVYPNPVKSNLFVDGLPQNATVKIYDMRGKLVLSSRNGNNQIDVNNFAKGVYSIQISGKNGITTKKFVKE